MRIPEGNRLQFLFQCQLVMKFCELLPALWYVVIDYIGIKFMTVTFLALYI